MLYAFAVLLCNLAASSAYKSLTMVEATTGDQ